MTTPSLLKMVSIVLHYTLSLFLHCGKYKICCFFRTTIFLISIMSYLILMLEMGRIYFTENRLTDNQLTDSHFTENHFTDRIISPTGLFHRKSYHRKSFHRILIFYCNLIIDNIATIINLIFNSFYCEKWGVWF